MLEGKQFCPQVSGDERRMDMGHISPHRERQIWQRVSQAAPPSREEVRPWMLAAMEAAAGYRQLAQSAGGRRKEQLLRLAEGEENAAACLRGMLTAAGGKSIPAALPPRKGSGGLFLRLRQCRESYRFYAGSAADPEYGAVFQHLAQRQGEQLELLLILMGSSGPGA